MSSPPWSVLLVCGAAGVGKSTLARALAAMYGVTLLEADDIVTALMAVTSAEQLPALHYWDEHPEAAQWSASRIAELHLAVADLLQPAFAAVIADHVESGSRVVIEGDYLLPDLALGSDDVRALVVVETSEETVVANFLAREPNIDEQRHRARVSSAVQSLLVERAGVAGIPVIAARPWADGVARVESALGEPVPRRS